MSTTTVKTCRHQQKNYTKIANIGGAVILLLSLWGCTATNFQDSPVTWNTYKNSRYGFEFPYPSNWKTLPVPGNSDGIALVSPQNEAVEIRSWAVNLLPESITTETNSKTKITPNFQTDQGISGVLLVEIDQEISLMKLSLIQDEVEYYWQGRSQNLEFPSYYPLFYYIAQQYRIGE
ncbi:MULTISPECIES: hypothetical protein [unclassified Anabaena]|uniref:hypothetical protein n=1 Tax=unclassified Anabaena TaxID=2619674 RepID=UPI0039C64BF1